MADPPNYYAPPHSFMSPPLPFPSQHQQSHNGGGNVVGFQWPPPSLPSSPPPQMSKGQPGTYYDFPAPKKQRISIEHPYSSHNNNGHGSSSNSNNRQNANNIFFKTRLCSKFEAGGCCPYGDNCNFAHGPQDLRKPPPNWAQIVNATKAENGHKLKICNKYSSGEVCPYGDKCTFLHEAPPPPHGRLYDGEPETPRDSSAISVNLPQALAHKRHCGGVDNPESYAFASGAAPGNPFSSSSVRSCSGPPSTVTLQKTAASRKTKMCNKWEMTGHCPYGDKCIFAHGQQELKKAGNTMEFGGVNSGSNIPTSIPNYASRDLPSGAAEANANQQDQPKTGFSICNKGIEYVSEIYADWPENCRKLVQGT